MQRTTPMLILALGILIASTAAILFTIAKNAGAPALVIAAGRLALGALILTPLALSKARPDLAKLTRRDLGLIIGAGIFLAIHFAAWFASLVYTSVASSTALVATIPIFVAIASVVLLREKLPRPVILGIGVSIIGSLIVGLSDSGGGATGSNPLLGDALALLGAAAATAYYLVGRKVRDHVHLLPYIWLCYGTAAIVLVLWVFGSGASFSGYNRTVWLAIVGLAIGPQLLGHTAFNWSLRYLSATFVSVAALGEPIGSTIMAWLFLDQVPKPLQILGGIVLLAGIFIATMGEKTSENQ